MPASRAVLVPRLGSSQRSAILLRAVSDELTVTSLAPFFMASLIFNSAIRFSSVSSAFITMMTSAFWNSSMVVVETVKPEHVVQGVEVDRRRAGC